MIEGAVMEWENALDQCEIISLWSNSSTSLALGECYHVVDKTQPLGLRNGFILQRLLGLLLGSSRANAMEPVLHSRPVDLCSKSSERFDPDKYQQGTVVSVSDFNSQPCAVEGSN